MNDRFEERKYIYDQQFQGGIPGEAGEAVTVVVVALWQLCSAYDSKIVGSS